MDACSQVFQNKRRRDEYSNGGLATPEAKRTNKGTLGYDSDLITSMGKIDNIDNNEETEAVNEVEVEMMLNWVKRSLEDEIGLKVKTDNNFESTHEKRSTDQMGSNKQGELTVEANSEIGLKMKTGNNFESTHEKQSTDQMGSNKQNELTVEVRTSSLTSDLGDFTYHDDVLADPDLFVDHITPDEFGMMMQNYLDRDSVPDIMYSDTMHGYIDSREAFYGSLWGNEHPVIRNDFASPQQEEFGISGANLTSDHQ